VKTRPKSSLNFSAHQNANLPINKSFCGDRKEGGFATQQLGGYGKTVMKLWLRKKQLETGCSMLVAKEHSFHY